MRWLLVTVASLSLVACQAKESAEPSGPLPAPMPEARTEVAGTAGLGGIVVVGGLRADGLASDRADVYDVDAGEWRSLPPLPSGLHHAGMATVRGRVHVVGGFTLTEDRQWAESPRALSLGPGETAWRDEPPLPFPRGALALVSTGSHLVALGGVSGGKVVSAVWTWRPGDADWTDAPAMAQAREHTAAAFLGGRVYAIAGRVGPLESNLASVESWAPGEAAWRPEPSLAHARGGIGATAVGDTVCVAGGEEPGATIGSVECLRDGRWREVATLATPRHGLAVVAFGGKLHVIGGGPQPGLFVSAAHEELTVG